MTPNARLASAAELLDQIIDGEAAERALTRWSRANRYAGSGDRAAIRDIVYDCLRRRRSLGWLGGADTGRALILGRLRDAGEDPDEVFTGERHAQLPLNQEERREPPPLAKAPEAVRLDVPDWLLPQLGAEAAAHLRHRAPVFLRANLARISRDSAIERLGLEGVTATAHHLSPSAMEITENPRRLSQTVLYREGLVELQDVASQAVVDIVAKRARGARVLDYCAGGGGKSLALAMHGGKVSAHDANPQRMQDLPARARRAGVTVDIIDHPKGPFDLVFCDVPCSGSGAWRRQPEAKWRFKQTDLDGLAQTQVQILETASKLAAPDGTLVYATCSLLRRENEDRIGAFLNASPGWHLEKSRRFTPSDGGDGFFVAVLSQN